MSPLPLPEALPAADESRRGTLVVRAAAALIAIAVIARAGHLMTRGNDARLEPPQQVTLLDPDELLPELEPPEEIELPEPEEMEVEIETAEEIDSLPEELADMMDDMLGLDAAGVAGSDAFGLKAKKGGRALIEGTDGSGLDPMQKFSGYAQGLESELKRIIEARADLRRKPYNVYLRLWIAESGTVDRCEIHRSTGDVTLDLAIVESIVSPDVSVDRPPADMPQPILIRVKANPSA